MIWQSAIVNYQRKGWGSTGEERRRIDAEIATLDVLIKNAYETNRDKKHKSPYNIKKQNDFNSCPRENSGRSAN